MTRLAGLLLALLGLALATTAHAATDAAAGGLQPVPALSRPVTDLSGTLAPADVDRLEAKIRAYRAQHGPQFAVLLVPTTQPETAFDYSMRVVEQWKLGDDKRDDGLLLLIAVQDRKMQVQVGYGLEGAIPDAVASRILRNVLAPRFRSGDFAGGIDAALDALMAAAAGEAPAGAAAPDDGAPGANGGLVACLVGGLVIGFVLSLFAGRLVGAASGGGVALALALLLSLGLGTALFVAFLVFVFVVGRGGGFGGLGGGFGRGGFGGGGGWSGGGGGFGGGGASGSW